MLLLHNKDGFVPSKKMMWDLGQSKTHPLQCHSQLDVSVLFSLYEQSSPTITQELMSPATG